MQANPTQLCEAYRRPFEQAWEAIGGNPGQVFEDLVRRYAEPQRAFHTIEHLHECLEWFGLARHLACRPAEVEVAIWFHDSVYRPFESDNEARSAALFAERAAACGVEAESIERVSALILSTADHEGGALRDGDLLSDIDLAVLGSAPARFNEYEDQIRTEYAAVDEGTYRRGRSQVLRGFLERLSIYRTEFFSNRLEAQARTNIGAVLSRFEAGEPEVCA